MKASFFKAVALVAAMTPLLGAAPVQADDNVLTAVMAAPLRTTDPTISTARITVTYGFMVFDTLLGLDKDLKVQPQMADYTVSDDKMTYTFTLRDGLKWQDGTPVTAADCIASLKRWGRNDAAARTMMHYVGSITAKSDKVFTIKLAKPFGQVLELIAKPAPIPAFMMPKRLAETPEGQPLPEIIGSGPFRFDSKDFQPGVQAVFTKFKGYVPRKEPASGSAGGKVVHFDKVVWEVMPDVQTALNALQSGDIDVMERLPTDLKPLVDMNDDIKVGVLKQLGSQLTGQFNHIQPPFNDPQVRRAAMYALDQEQLMITSVSDPKYYTLCASIFGCTVPLASDAGKEYLEGTAEERMAKAKKLLAESNYNGEPVIMLQPTDNPVLNRQPIVAAERLREAGFKVQIESMDWATMSARRRSMAPPTKGGWSMFFTSWGIEGIWNPLADPLIDGTGDPKAYQGWRKSPEVEKLRADYIHAKTLAEQKEIARKIQQIAYDDAFYFNGGEFELLSAWNANIKGWVLGMNTQFWGIHR